ncbi:putative lactoylglutathione lyase [Aurantimicrobium minutum]|uniref:VOC family protein n=1 Tax=Aurantimicrobium minutum TaxID=708131 RepID=UPI0024739D62|nr:VOC family protein [Aurantimicrobium minutum]MDH6531900.1 putative lactoylglutathione lyase [Aurantimicrobium minutum]
MLTSIFVNLPVASVQKSVEFFTELGFTFNAQFTDDQSTCMIVNETIYVMLIEHEKFSGFIDKPIAPTTSTEAIFAFSCESIDEVKSLSEKAFGMGARRINDPEDHGFMFSWGFEDLDGHLWDLFWMNPDHVN